MYDYEHVIRLLDEMCKQEDYLVEQFTKSISTNGSPTDEDNQIIHSLIEHTRHYHPNPCIVETDLEGNILYANDEFLRISRYTYEEIIGKNMRIFKSGHMPNGVYTKLWNTILAGKAWNGQLKNKSKDYDNYWIHQFIAPVFNDEGVIQKFWCLGFDITESMLQKEENEAKNTDIMESIRYAKRIQKTILPDKKAMDEVFDDYFVIFKPKDIVSGDFYWFTQTINKAFIAVVDCTGHGVPGAFMSLIGYNLLNQIVLQRGIHNPGDILTELHIQVRATLKQDAADSKSRDGMDVCLLALDKYGDTMEYAGAYRPLWYMSADSDELIEIKADKCSIGGEQMEEERQYTNHEIEINDGDTFYLFTDGFVDQFGGPDFKKFSTKRLRQVLIDNRKENMNIQRAMLNMVWKDWKEDAEQTDDVSMIGIRF